MYDKWSQYSYSFSPIIPLGFDDYCPKPTLPKNFKLNYFPKPTLPKNKTTIKLEEENPCGPSSNI